MTHKLSAKGHSQSFCCCCLELLCFKNLWSEYIWMDEVEIYGKMFQQCFGVSLSQEHSGICEVCITQLRNAVTFKKIVIAAQEKLKSQVGFKATDYTNDVKFELDQNYDNDENLLGDGFASEDDEVLAKFKNTRTKKLVQKRKKGRRELNYMKMRQNVCLILENSTILPFRSNKGYFTCFYCDKQHAVYEELKDHMTEHRNVTIKDSLKCLIRPHAIKADAGELACKICHKRPENIKDLIRHLSEEHQIKFDYESKMKPVDCILPYDLSEGRFRCFVCKKEFLFFKTLSKHMNEHSTNYICDICGKCFILPERLRAHKQNMHIDNCAVKCEECGKICSSNVILRSHIRYAHKKILYVCSICDHKFPSFKKRMKHLEEFHGKTTLNLRCEKCFKSFKTPGSLNDHIRREHLKIVKEAKFPCDICAMVFKTRSALKCHGVVHSGEKNYECEVCHKKYGRSRTLSEHMKIHRNDRRWACAACGQAFVQKCSLKNHVRVHHSEMNPEQLVICKEPDKT